MICGISADALVVLVAWTVSTLLFVHEMDEEAARMRRAERLYRRHIRRLGGGTR